MDVLCHYYRLLLVVKWWTPEERSRFFEGKNYLNQFGAPVYKSITRQAVNEARKFTATITRERRFNRKRSCGAFVKTSDRRSKQGKVAGPFKHPVKDQTLLPTNREQIFRSDKGLCFDCVNHKKDNETACTLHPLYEDMRHDKLSFRFQKVTWDLELDTQQITKKKETPGQLNPRLPTVNHF